MIKESNSKNTAMYTIVIIVFFLVGFVLSTDIRKSNYEEIPEGVLWPNPPKINSFFLNDSNNQAFTLDSLRGKWSILFFGFTNCPDICPSTLNTLAKIEREVDSIEEIQLIFVSVDPERDSNKVLKLYTSNFSDTIIPVSGSMEELKILASSVGALFIHKAVDENFYSVDHSAGLFIINPDAQLFSVITPPIHSNLIKQRLLSAQKFFSKHRAN
tara:strand:- start:103 stop:744 length:642 start_codon:yes stop_codon:yes gene_type:complete